MSLKFTGELCVMAMKNDAKFQEELTFSPPTRAFNLATRAFCVLIREFELVTRRFELITCGFELKLMDLNS